MKHTATSTPRILALAAAVWALCALAAGAQTPTPQPRATAPAAQPAAKKDSISFSALRVESVLGKGKEKTILNGKAKVVTGSLEINADRIEITGENYSLITCKGAVTVKDGEKGFTLITENLSYDRPAQISRTEGGATLEDSQNGIVLKAEWIEFDQRNETVLAQISVFISKEDFAARSEYALFNRRENTLVMTGVPTVKTKDATLSATTISGTGADNLQIAGNVSGTIETAAQEEAPKPGESAPAKPTEGT